MSLVKRQGISEELQSCVFRRDLPRHVPRIYASSAVVVCVKSGHSLSVYNVTQSVLRSSRDLTHALAACCTDGRTRPVMRPIRTAA